MRGSQPSADDRRPVLAFFRSEESGPARRMDSLIAHLARKERGRLNVTVVDVDARPELAARFRVEVVPTLVLVKDRQIVGRLEGRASAPRIQRLLQSHLPSAEPRSTLEPMAAAG